MKNEASMSIIVWFFVILFSLSIFLIGWLIWPFISVIVIGIVVTGIFKPLYDIFDKKFNSSIASAITCIIIFVTIFIPFVFFIGVLSKEAYDLYLMAKNAVFKEQIQTLLENTALLDRANVLLSNFSIEISGDELKNSITELGKIIGLFLYKQASGIASNLISLLINFFFMLIIVYFLLIDLSKLVSFIENLFPLPKNQTKELIDRFKDISAAILIGNGLGGLIQGVLGGAMFALFGLKSPIVWGVVMGFLAFLPIAGIGLVFIPAAIYLFLIGKTAAAIIFIVFYIILSGSIEYIFKPKLVGSKVQIHTLLIFLSIIGGLKLFGILGIIYGPLIATAFLTLAGIYQASYQQVIEQTSNE